MKLNIRFLMLFVLLFAVALTIFMVCFNCSLWHKNLSYKDICNEHADNKEVKIILFLYFSKNNCSDCIHPIFTILKKLPSYFYYYGVVPNSNSFPSSEYFEKIGLKIKLFESSKLADDSTHIYPSLAGFKKNGDLIFMLPFSYIGSQILEEYLYSLYYNNVGMEIKSR